MKKIIISGSSKLVGEVKYWVNYFKERGYEILDYPKYVSESKSSKNYEEQMAKIYYEYYCSLEKTDIYFLMNEEKNGIEGYIGSSAISELTYVVVQNLIHSKNVDIYILKEPSKELGCYEEVKFWLDKGWIKLWGGEIK